MSAADSGLFLSWEFLDCDGDVLQSRSGHTCALYRNKFLYVFGGFDGSNCFDDLYCLDLDTRLWQRLEAGGDRPSGRASHSAVTDELAGVMYIFGGSGSHFGYTNKRDLYEFCFETENWKLLSNPLDDTPSARYGQSMVAYREGLYVWGGTHGTNYPTDMHRFDLCSKQWEYVVTMGDLPCGRYRHQAMVKDDLMYIVGGSGINRYGDVFTFHFNSCVWKKLVCTGLDLSDGRYAHSAVLRGNFVYLYGGNDGVRHDDLLQLDLDSRVWSRVAVHGQCPPGRDFHSAVLRKDSMVIFGGSSGMQRHNDAYEFFLPPLPLAERYEFNRAPKIPPCTLSEDLCLLLEVSQADEAAQSICDVFLAAENGSQGIYCHSRLILVRCPLLYQYIQRYIPGNSSETETQSTGATTESAGGLDEHQFLALQNAGGADVDDAEETIDSLFREVNPPGEDRRTPQRHSRVHRKPAGWNPHVAWVPTNLPELILWNFILYLYAEFTRFGRMTIEQLYKLFLAAKKFDIPRLAALCERQVKIQMSLENVLPLLTLSTSDGAIASQIQEACKHFFLANYNHCAELADCEALGPKLLCELMRLHNSRASVAGAAGEGNFSGRRSTAGPSILCPSPSGLGFSGVSVHLLAEGECTSPEKAVGSKTVCTTTSGGMPPPTLADDMRRLLTEEDSVDFEVVVQSEVICAHRFVLAARCRYFASCLLTSGMVEAQNSRLIIPETSAMTAAAFRALLRFVYAGDDVLAVLVPHTAMYLIEAASFYGLTNSRLKHFCELCVRDSFNEAHVLQLFEASCSLNVEAVRAMALEFIISHFDTVGRQPALEQLDKPLLLEILKGLAERFPPNGTRCPDAIAPHGLG